MQSEKLTLRQMKRIYRKHIRRDFPPNERKPLAMLVKSMKNGEYDCYSLNEGGEALAYAFFEKLGSDRLIDYFATVSGKRGRGYGSEFMSLLRAELKDATSVIAEVEDPEFADSDEEREIRNRRLNFYMRNGFSDTGVRAKTFGVDYIIIEMIPEISHTPEKVKELYQKQYRAMLPTSLFNKNVKVK